MSADQGIVKLSTRTVIAKLLTRCDATWNKSASLFGYIGIAAFVNLFNIVTTICYLDLQPTSKPDLLPCWHKVPNIA